MLKFAKAALLLFWLLALANLAWPFAGAYLGWIALTLLLVHGLEIALLHRRLSRRPQPWRERLLVLLFGVLHLRGMAA
ncbi:DUF1145 domain-containing protein [Pseudomonas subflava]|uniref:DUF1145 domain-containing protein n=1 Tax=Pseudomonas subflava TaxID=2952933 RepID=UPI00207AE678|nr:DUF1145 domain-containing protein [Pseudomonas subflava]